MLKRITKSKWAILFRSKLEQSSLQTTNTLEVCFFFFHRSVFLSNVYKNPNIFIEPLTCAQIFALNNENNSKTMGILKAPKADTH